VVDIVDAATRSRMMSGIRHKNTQPELFIRRALHRRGFRFRLHSRDLPGRPDLVFPKLKAAILVHGCFWHAHDCDLFRLPATRREWWQQKIYGNRARDERVTAALAADGWSTMTVWECALKGKQPAQLELLVARIVRWLDNPSRRSATIPAPKSRRPV
jgi:DNA mismatch endonuclease (patch repair protein)